MKKPEASKPGVKRSDDLLPKYKFDYSKASPNRFAARIKKEDVTVTLDPDVSEVFTTSESVNAILGHSFRPCLKLKEERLPTSNHRIKRSANQGLDQNERNGSIGRSFFVQRMNEVLREHAGVAWPVHVRMSVREKA